MPVIRHLRVVNFRGIRTLDWHVDGRIVCLVGPGDSAKTTVLNAIELALLPRWSTAFTDSDFYEGDPSEGFAIEVTVGELPEVLVKKEKYGLYLRGYSVAAREIHDDPGDDDEDVLTIRLSVDSNLEPQWAVVKESNSESRPISWRDREGIPVASLGEDVDRNLSWGRGSALARLTGSESSARAIALANRKAQEAVEQMQLDEWQMIADGARKKVRDYGVPAGDLHPGLDVRAIRFGQGVLSLYDGPIPLQSYGLGSKRLAALAIQESGVGASSILLIDEIEHGLEPHRTRKLLKLLCEERDSGQVILTSHSPTAVVVLPVDELRFARYAGGRLDVLACEESARDALQPVLRRNPLALFARSVVVCEGKTEVALCSALGSAWAAAHDGTGLELQGVVAVEGGGRTVGPQAAAQLSKLGYRTAYFGDSDEPLDPTAGELRKLGVEVVVWDGKMSTEQRIAEDVPVDVLQDILSAAAEVRGESSCADCCSTQFKNAGIPTAGTIGIDVGNWMKGGVKEADVRLVIGQAAKTSEWFKNLSEAEKLGKLVAEALPRIATSPLAVQLRALELWVYGG